MAKTFMAAVEGLTDEAILRRIAESADATISTTYGRQGKGHLIKRLPGFNRAARHSSWVVLMDLDHDASCAASFRDTLLDDAAPGMNLRIAVRSIESWLLADAQSFAQYFRLSRARIPIDPDQLDNPKQAVVNLCRGSRSRLIVSDVVPRHGSGRSTGPLYVTRMIEFAESGGWRPEVAAESSDSLRRFIRSLRR